MARPFLHPRTLRLLTLLIILSGCALALAATAHRTPTYDEPRHLQMGRQILEEGSWARFDNSKMPVSVLNALPGLDAPPPGDEPGDWLPARAPQVLWLAGCALLAAWWARRLYGDTAALAVAAVVAWEPNLLAHGALVTTDLPCTFFVLATLYTTWRALRRGTFGAWALAGAVLGAAQAAKFTAVFLFPILLPVLLVHVTVQACRRRTRASPWTVGPRRLVLALLTCLATLNACYGFQGTFTPASAVDWRSRLLAPLARTDLPLPVPGPWVEGLDWVRADDELGHGNVYADGRVTAEGRPDYYLRTLSRKLPLPLLVLGLAALVLPWRRGMPHGVLTWPALFLFGWFSLAFNFQIGIRYCLPLVPLVAVGIGRLPWWLGLAGAVLELVSGLTWFPHYLPYQNERLRHRVDAWRYVADSNLDWGQEGLARDRWKREHPAGQVNPDVPAPGPVLVSANHLTGVLGDPARLACLRLHFPPRRHRAYTWYPYHLAPSDLEACFPPRTWVPGEGDLRVVAEGDPLVVVLRARGDAWLQAGSAPPVTGSPQGAGEHLVGMVLHAPPGPVEISYGSFDSANGTVLGVYVDGRPISGNATDVP